MTSKYMESPVSSAVYQRCEEIRIFNPYQAVPTVMFFEEQVWARPNGSVIHDKVGSLTKLITNINETFPIYNPATQTKVGQDASIGQLYALIWSVYMHEAVKRDAEQARFDSEQASRLLEETYAANYSSANLALHVAFDSEDATLYAAAVELAATKVTTEEKASVMADYQAAKDVRLATLTAAVVDLTASYEAAKKTRADAAVVAAAAAYTAVINA